MNAIGAGRAVTLATVVIAAFGAVRLLVVRPVLAAWGRPIG